MSKTSQDGTKQKRTWNFHSEIKHVTPSVFGLIEHHESMNHYNLKKPTTSKKIRKNDKDAWGEFLWFCLFPFTGHFIV